MQYAGAWQRFSASAADGFILSVLTFLLSFFVDPPGWMGDDGLAFAIGLVYSLRIGSKQQATPGMWKRKIHVVMADGGRIGYGMAFCRYLAFSIPFAFDLYVNSRVSILALLDNPKLGVLWLAGLFLHALWCLPILFDKEKAGVHDMICNTRVVKGRAAI
jgi:uncharacterized RDD family membrane protein YckC